MGSKCCLQIELPFFIDHKPLYKEYRRACSISPYHCLQWVQLAISIDVVYRWEKFARAFRTYDILVKFNRLGNTYEILARVSSRFFHGNGLLNLFNNYLKIRSRMCTLINRRYPWTKEATDYYCNEITIKRTQFSYIFWIVNMYWQQEFGWCKNIDTLCWWLTMPVFIVSVFFVVSFVHRDLDLLHKNY